MKRLLPWLDRRNQRVVDLQRGRDDLGKGVLPYARSRRARAILVVLVVAIFLVAMLFGLLAGIAAVAVATPLAWTLEHHPFWERRKGN